MNENKSDHDQSVSEESLTEKIAMLNNSQDRLDVRLQALSRNSAGFPKLTFLVIVLLVVAFAIFVIHQNRRVDELQNSIHAIIISEIDDLRSDNIPDEAVTNLTNRLKYIELQQKSVIDHTKNSMERMYFFFTTVAAFFGIVSLFFGYRQITADARKDESRERHDAEMKNLVGSFQNNITAISSLIGTLKESFDYRKQIESNLVEIDKRAKGIEDVQRKDSVIFKTRVDDLNRSAVELAEISHDRTRMNLEENKHKLSSFSQEFDNLKTNHDVTNVLNPFCFYVHGLWDAALYEYEDAHLFYGDAYSKGTADLAAREFPNYSEQHRDGIHDRIKTMLVWCSFYRGVGYKNTADYSEAIQQFQAAIERNPEHLLSRAYLLQVMFLGQEGSKQSIQEAYSEAYNLIKGLKQKIEFGQTGLKESDVNKGYSTLKLFEGNMYLPKLFPLPEVSSYDSFIKPEPERAFSCYCDAYDAVSDDLTAFALAQTCEYTRASARKGHDASDLYSKTMRGLKIRIASDHDKLYSVMLYYTLAFCAKKVESETVARYYLAQARDGLRDVPIEVTHFSPISKIRLHSKLLLKEMELFENTI